LDDWNEPFPWKQVNASREIWTQALLTIDKQDLKLICDLLQRGPPYVESELERAELERYRIVAEVAASRFAGKSRLKVGKQEVVQLIQGTSKYLKYFPHET
jgi:hypothetical protein